MDSNRSGGGDRDYARLQKIVARFEGLWVKGARPRIDGLLEGVNPFRIRLLIELAHTELEFRLKRGEPARVEEYVARYPALGQSRSVLLGLIRTEWAIRRRTIPSLKIGDYRERFPKLALELEGIPDDASTLRGGREPTPDRFGSPSARPPEVEPPLPRRVGKFVLKERLGEGSYGVVYRALDTVLNHEVAVKLLHFRLISSADHVRTFLREARNAFPLNHPGIVKVRDAGPIDGTYCVVRDHVRGTTLADRMQKSPYNANDSARLIATVCRALDHAHTEKTIHRDLKPTNILIDEQGEPHVVDFGLAKREEGDTTLSPDRSGYVVIGSPYYMPPEQARGEASRVDARSDVFSTGVILYEMITGSRPFTGRGRILEDQIENRMPTSPRALNEDVPEALETICLRALAKKPGDRYPSAAAMARDLEDFLKSGPVTASRQVAPVRPARKFDHKLGRSIAGVGAILSLIGLVVLVYRSEVRQARDRETIGQVLRAIHEISSLAARHESQPGRQVADRVRAEAARLALEIPDDSRFDDETARLLVGLVDSAEPGEPSPTPEAEAWALWDRLSSIVDRQARDRPDDLATRGRQARTLEVLSRIESRAGRSGRARRLRDRHTEVRRIVLDGRRARSFDRPKDPDAHLDWADAVLGLDRAERSRGEVRPPLEFESAIGRVRDLVVIEAAQKRRLAGLLVLKAVRDQEIGDQARALMTVREAIRISETVDGLGVERARSRMVLGEIYQSLGMTQEARDHFALASESFARLSDLEPSRIGHRRDEATAIHRASLIELGQERLGPATELGLRALSIRHAIRLELPRSVEALADRAESFAAIGSTFERLGLRQVALAYTIRAVLDDLAAHLMAPGEPSYRASLEHDLRQLKGLIQPLIKRLVVTRSD